MFYWIKCLLNGHFFQWKFNTHGDEIIFAFGGNRSVWRCNCCGKWKIFPDLIGGKENFRR
jgi:hypothetical protein